jgi:hypothetical protein
MVVNRLRRAAASSSSSASATPSSTSSSMAPDDVSNIITTPVTINLWSITGKTYQTQLNKFVEASKLLSQTLLLTRLLLVAHIRPLSPTLFRASLAMTILI